MLRLGLLIFAAIGLVLLFRPGTVAAKGITITLNGWGDQAIATGPLDTGSAWYDYWRKVLSDTYTQVGVMPPEGPLVACLVAPCPGTPTPQSP